MIQELTIKNFALIEHAHLVFDAGYTVITGETGSGKSILLNALNLLLGERADYKVIGSQGEKALVEATFQIDQTKFESFFAENELDFFPSTIVRREITVQGRSRSFINDIPVSLSVLQDFSKKLISIHSQYNTLDLKRKDFQMQTLDILAGTTLAQEQFSQLFEQYRKIQKEIEVLSAQLKQHEKDSEYNNFQRKELEELQLESTNFEDAEQLLSRLEHAHEIRQIQQTIAHELSKEFGVLDALHQLNEHFHQLKQLDSAYQNVEERMQALIAELKDIEEEISQSLSDKESIDEDQHQEQLQSMLALIDNYNRALVKHKCRNQRELLERYVYFQNASTDVEILAEKLLELKTESDKLLKIVWKSAENLHKARHLAVQDIERHIQFLLSELKLPDTQLLFQLQQGEQLSTHGCSVLSMLFSANKGFPPVEIEKAASGGELSRVMLALQQLISEKTQLPTIFFDEIDTGVSGDVAEKIGVLLRQMGKQMQLFAISHLPQVAAKATHHLKVEKTSTDEKVKTTIYPLSQNERVEEIARLMSGETINQGAIANAKSLME